MTTALFVAVRIIANPVSNVFQKRLADARVNPLFVIVATHALLSVAALPFLPQMRLSSLTPGFWRDMAVSAILAVAGNVLLVYALKSSDLSVLGSVNAYKAVLSLVLSIFLIGEVPSAAGMVGVALILSGSYFVVDRSEDQPYRRALVQRIPRVSLLPGTEHSTAAVRLGADDHRSSDHCRARPGQLGECPWPPRSRECVVSSCV